MAPWNGPNNGRVGVASVGDRLSVTNYCYEYVCLSVCLFVCCPLIYLENHTAELHQFLCTLPTAVARSFSGGVAIRYVLPVLWMTPC